MTEISLDGDKRYVFFHLFHNTIKMCCEAKQEGDDAMENNLSVLLMDGEAEVRQNFHHLLSSKGVHVLTARNAREAWELLRDHKIDAVVSDTNITFNEGELWSKRIFDSYPVVMIASESNGMIEKKLIDLCDAYIDKEDASQNLYNATLKAIQRRALGRPQAAA